MPMSRNSHSCREECAFARPFDVTQWRHQLLSTARPVNSCSAICLALGSRGRLGTLGTMSTSPSAASSRIGSCAPPALPESSGSGFFWSYKFASIRQPPEEDSGAASVLFRYGFMKMLYALFSLCTQLCNRCIVNPSSPSGFTHRFSSQQWSLCGTRNLCHHTNSTHRRVLSNRQQRLTHQRLRTPRTLRLTLQSSRPSTYNHLPDLTSSPVAVRKVRSLSPGIVLRSVTLWATPSFLHLCQLQSGSIRTISHLNSIKIDIVHAASTDSTSGSASAGFVESRL